MSWSAANALSWTERAIAVALFLQTIELLQIRRTFADDGVWRWSTLRPEHAALPFPLRQLFAIVMPYRAFVALLAVRLAASALLFAGHSRIVWLAAFSQIAICVRFRGTFNGGSDYMTVLILLALCAAQRPALQPAALFYIAVQATLSYVIAGLVKLRQPAWRDGEALRTFLRSNRYGSPARVRRLASRPVSQLLAIAVIAFECGFPLAFIDPRACLWLLAIGLCFHAANALVFGLNRFLFAWAAAYPAVWFCSQLLGSST